jgi:hypothetical protein
VPVKNILNARRWYEAIRKGASFITIAEQEKPHPAASSR